MILINFTDREHSETWDHCKIHDSGKWVILWDEGEDGQRDRVPIERIRDISDWSAQRGLPKVTNEGQLPRDWPFRRQRVLVRDGFLCQNCWKLGGEVGSKELEVHHIVPRGVSEMTHRISNLITLCSTCHKAIPKP